MKLHLLSVFALACLVSCSSDDASETGSATKAATRSSIDARSTMPFTLKKQTATRRECGAPADFSFTLESEGHNVTVGFTGSKVDLKRVYQNDPFGDPNVYALILVTAKDGTISSTPETDTAAFSLRFDQLENKVGGKYAIAFNLRTNSGQVLSGTLVGVFDSSGTCEYGQATRIEGFDMTGTHMYCWPQPNEPDRTVDGGGPLGDDTRRYADECRSRGGVVRECLPLVPLCSGRLRDFKVSL